MPVYQTQKDHKAFYQHVKIKPLAKQIVSLKTCQKVTKGPDHSITQLQIAAKAYQSHAGNDLIAQRKQPIQKKENNTGLPEDLKSGIEHLSGYSMDDVKVHYHSPKPAQLQAHAYAQGLNIHIASGQEKHLPHEAWHLVQQKQGRVNPTLQMKDGLNINDDAVLEKEADIMGVKALQLKSQENRSWGGNGAKAVQQQKRQGMATLNAPVQRFPTGWNPVKPAGQSRWLKRDFQTPAVRTAITNERINLRADIADYNTGNRHRRAQLNLLAKIGRAAPPTHLETALKETDEAYVKSYASGRVNAQHWDLLFTRLEAMPLHGAMLALDIANCTAQYNANTANFRAHFAGIAGQSMSDNALNELIAKPYELDKLTDFGGRLAQNAAVPATALPKKKKYGPRTKSKKRYLSIVDNNVAISIHKKNTGVVGSALETRMAGAYDTMSGRRNITPTLTTVGVGEYRVPAPSTIATHHFGRLASPADRNSTLYNNIYAALRLHGVGADKGVMDASMVADAFMASGSTHVTEFFTGDADVIVGLAQIAHLPNAQTPQLDTAGRNQAVSIVNRAKMIYHVTHGSFQVTLYGRRIMVKPIAEDLSAPMKAQFNIP